MYVNAVRMASDGMSAGTQAIAVALARMARRDPAMAELLRQVRHGDPEAGVVLEAIHLDEDKPSDIRLVHSGGIDPDFQRFHLDDDEDA